MAALAYTSHAFSESAVWPLLAIYPLTLKQLQTYLEASRGSIPSSPSALYSTRSAASIVVLLCAVIITLIPLSSGPVVGYVYQRQNISETDQSLYYPGGGIGPSFRQRNPPASIRDTAASHYTSWSRELSKEPLDKHREWFIDRTNLSYRGELRVVATKFNRNITCRPWQLPRPTLDLEAFYIDTVMHKRNKRQAKSVKVLRRPRLAVWAHDYNHITSTRTVSTLILAAVNGSIVGGSTTTDLPHQNPDKNIIKKISALACDVDLELVEDVLAIGTPNSNATPVHINTLADIKVTHPIDEDQQRYDPVERPEDTLNELILWFTVAPVTNGASVEGAQPLYQHGGSLPIRHTSTAVGGDNDEWEIPYIVNFIEASIGASILGDSGNFPNDKVPPKIFTSRIPILKLQPSRCKVLLIPPAILLVHGIILLVMNIYLHRRLRMPIMRLATLSEIIKSAQTDNLSRQAANDMLLSDRCSQLEKVPLQFCPNISGVWDLSCLDDNLGLLGGTELRLRGSMPGSSVTLEYEGYQQ